MATVSAAASGQALSVERWAETGNTSSVPVFAPLVDNDARERSAALSDATSADWPFAGFRGFVKAVGASSWVRPGYAPERFPHTELVELPGVIPTGLSGADLLWHAAEAGVLDTEFSEAVPLALWTAPPNVLVMREAEVRAPADLAGLRIRVVGAVATQVIEALGAVPVHVPARELRASLDVGLIDGVLIDPVAVQALGLDEVATRYTLNLPLGQTSYAVAVDRALHETFSGTPMSAVDAVAGRPLSRAVSEAWAAKAQEVVAGLGHAGGRTVITLSEEERGAFSEVARAAADEVLRARGASEVLATMQGR